MWKRNCKILFYLYMSKCGYVNQYESAGAHRILKRLSYQPEQELHVVWSWLILVLGNDLRSSTAAVCLQITKPFLQLLQKESLQYVFMQYLNHFMCDSLCLFMRCAKSIKVPSGVEGYYQKTFLWVKAKIFPVGPFFLCFCCPNRIPETG